LEFSRLEKFFRKNLRKKTQSEFWRAQKKMLKFASQAKKKYFFRALIKHANFKTKIPQNNVVQNEILYFTKKRFILI